MLVLSVEDSPDLQLLYKTVIRMEGHECITVETATKAREYLLKNPAPDLLMLDLTLPDALPEQIGRYFEDIPGFRSIPLWVCSGLDELNLWGRRFGAQRSLKKPIDISYFKEILKQDLKPKKALSVGL